MSSTQYGLHSDSRQYDGACQVLYKQRDTRLFFEQNSHQLGFVAHHIHLCFQTRMSDESQLAPHPRL